MNTKELEKILKVFASRRRIDIIRFLKKKKEATVGEIARGIGLSLKAASKHLRILYSADILERDNKSWEAYYQLSNDKHPVAKTVIKLIYQNR